MKIIGYILLFIILPSVEAFAGDGRELLAKKKNIEQKIQRFDNFREDIERTVDKGALSDYFELFRKAATLGSDSLKYLSRFYRPRINAFHAADSKLNEIEDELFNMQKDIKANEKNYKLVLKIWRRAWDKYAHLEITLKNQMRKDSRDMDAIALDEIAGLKNELKILNKDIMFIAELDAVEIIKKKAFFRGAGRFYNFIAKDSTKWDEGHLEGIRKADMQLFSKFKSYLDSEPIEGFIELSDKFLDFMDQNYKGATVSRLLNSDSLLTEYIVHKADSIITLDFNKSLALKNCIPVIKGNYKKENDMVQNPKAYYIRKTPLSKEEFSLFLLSNRSFGLVNHNKYDSLIISRKESIKNRFGIDILAQDEIDYLSALKADDALTAPYSYKLKKINIDPGKAYLKLDIGAMEQPYGNIADSVANYYWLGAHPRMLLLKYSLGASIDYFTINPGSIEEKIGALDYGNISNSLLIAYRFNFSGYTDEYSDYIGVKYTNIANASSENDFIYKSYPEDSITISLFDFSGGEFSVEYGFRDKGYVGIGNGSGELHYMENINKTVFPYSVDLSYWFLTGGISLYSEEIFSIDLFGKLLFPEKALEIFTGSIGISFSGRLPVLRK